MATHTENDPTLAGDVSRAHALGVRFKRRIGDGVPLGGLGLVGAVLAFPVVFVLGVVLSGTLAGLVHGSPTTTAAAAASNAVAAPAAPAPAVPASVMVHLSDQLKIDPADITVAEGGTINVMNIGAIQHNLAVRTTSLATPMINGGGSATLALAGLAPGTYTVYCQAPGHDAAGMHAALHILSAGGSGGGGVPAAALAPSASPSMTVAQMDAQMAASIKAFPAKTQGLGGQVLAPTVLPDGTKEFDLTAEVVRWEVAPGSFVDAWTYNGTVPGPTIKVNPGDRVKVVLTNKLPESTAIHFHGIVTPNSMDGVPGITQPPVDPGQTFTYAWTVQSTPAVGMYHSHQDAVKQVPNGLAGAFLVGEEPVPAGVKVAQSQIMMLNDSGTIGLTINGKSFPATAPITAKLGDWIEIQYLNEGQMIHPMHLHGMAQLVVAEDGYAVPQSYNVDTLMVAPGQRFTVLIHADNPGTWAWHCHILSHAENDQGMFGMVTALVVS